MKKPRLPFKILAALALAAMMLTGFAAAPAFAANHTGVDFAARTELNPQKFIEQGVTFVARYIAGGGRAKELTRAEADLWSRSGVNIVLVWETTAARAKQGYDAGYHDASLAYPQATELGMPDGKPVYFAVDVDTDGPSVQAYFNGVYDWARTHFTDGMATSRIGIYGGYSPVKYVMRAGYAQYGWQSRGWMYGRGWLPNVMQQHAYNVTIDGVPVDVNRVPLDEFGQWSSTRVFPERA